MTKLSEREIITPFIGKSVNPEHFNSIGYHNGGNNYLICNADYINSPEFCTMFGITGRLKSVWGYSGVDFSLCLTFANWVITEAHLYKCRDTGYTSKVLTETQQELRIAKRILEYITL